MIEVIAFDIIGGERRKSLGTFDSLQMTGTTLRDGDGNIILQILMNDPELWVDNDGDMWFDWTVGDGRLLP